MNVNTFPLGHSYWVALLWPEIQRIRVLPDGYRIHIETVSITVKRLTCGTAFYDILLQSIGRLGIQCLFGRAISQ